MTTLSQLHEIIHAALPEILTHTFPEGTRHFRKIQLADVLRVIEKTLGKYDHVSLYTDNSGTQFIVERGTYDGEGDTYYSIGVDLSKDLDQQLPEVHTFLLSLLTNKD